MTSQSKYTQEKYLLKEVSRIVRHYNELIKLKGEVFNVFSILNLESNENRTHSAFIGELLNPKGKHLLQTLFLEAFLETINYQGNLNTKKATLKLEKYIGVRNDTKKTGGRIDIYIYDNEANSISIENKIYAGDQNAQIERYFNFIERENTVYYLTLDGHIPTKKSKGKLKEEIDFFCISYQDHIVDWLKICLKEASEYPIVRESIKQYLILIKKITNQLTDSKMDKEIQDLISNNYNAAKLIESAIHKIEVAKAHQFLMEVKELLEDKINTDKDWIIEVDDNLNISWSGLKLTHRSWNGIKIKIEGSSKIAVNKSIYGIHAPKSRYNRQEINSKLQDVKLFSSGFRNSKVWPFYKEIFSLANKKRKDSLFNDQSRKDFVVEVAEKLIEMAVVCKDKLTNISKI